MIVTVLDEGWKTELFRAIYKNTYSWYLSAAATLLLLSCWLREIPRTNKSSPVGTLGIKIKTLTNRDDDVDVRCCIPDSNQLFPVQCNVDVHAVRWLWLLKLMQTISYEWWWLHQDILVCLSIYVWNRYVLVPVPVLQKLYLLVTSIMIGYIHRDICMCMLYQRGTFPFFLCYRLPNIYRLPPITVVKSGNRGNTPELPGNYRVIAY